MHTQPALINFLYPMHQFIQIPSGTTEHAPIDHYRKQDEQPVLNHARHVHGQGACLANEHEHCHIERCTNRKSKQASKIQMPRTQGFKRTEESSVS